MRSGFWHNFRAMGMIASLKVAGVAALAVLGFWACSSDKSVAGNSAETGSPELAGILYLGDGVPAGMARVMCVPSDFDAQYDTLAANLDVVTDEQGAYHIDSVVPGSYSLEAYHAETGKRLLIQNITVADTGVFSQNGTLTDAGLVLLKLQAKYEDGVKGVALVQGTTILRNVVVKNGLVLVDSLPADSLQLILRLGDDASDLKFGGLPIASGDTLKVGFDEDVDPSDSSDVIPSDSCCVIPSEVEGSPCDGLAGQVLHDGECVDLDTIPADTSDIPEAPVDTVILSFVAPLALPADVVLDSDVDLYSSDIPLALRLDSTNCDFGDFEGLEGRWEVVRISPDGARSKKMPIVQSIFDIESQQGVFWVRVDSLNLTDSLELTFNTSMSPVYAADMFATNRNYTAVYHYDDGVESIEDASEKNGFTATGKNIRLVDGVLGHSAELSGDAGSVIVVDNSAASDSSKHTDLNFAYGSNMNISFWLRLDDLSKPATILAKGESQYDLRYAPDTGFVAEFFHQAEVPASEKDSTADTASYVLTVSGGAELLKKGEWTFVTWNKFAGYFELFINGAKLPGKSQKVAWKGVRDESMDLQVGPFAGAIDELSISKTGRGAGWTYATYLNQRPGVIWPALAPRE